MSGRSLDQEDVSQTLYFKQVTDALRDDSSSIRRCEDIVSKQARVFQTSKDQSVAYQHIDA
jgi:hypothetical protein